jgi:hypothetical protein
MKRACSKRKWGIPIHAEPIQNYPNFTMSKIQLPSIIASIIVFILSAFLLYLLGGKTSNDASQYEIIFYMIRDTSFFEAYSKLRYEIGSLLVIWNLSQFSSASMTFYLVGFIALLIKFVLFQKYLNYPSLAFLVYSLMFIHVLEANQIRAALASCVIFYALFKPVRNIYTYFLLAILASLFHYSAVIILALYFVRVPLVAFGCIVLLGLIFDFIILNLDYFSFAEIWLADPGGHVNLTNSLFIMQICISIVCAINWRRLSEGQQKGAYFNMVGIIVYLSFLDNAQVAHRIRELSQLGIFPILFLGEYKLTFVKLVSSLALGYMIVYNIWIVMEEVILKYELALL